MKNQEIVEKHPKRVLGNSGGKGDWQQEGTPKAVKRQKKPDPSHMIRLTPVVDSIFPPIEEFPWSNVMGRFSGLWIVLLATPSRPSKNQDSGNYVWLSSPLTAAGPRRILTVFPGPKHLPLLHLPYNPEKFFCQYLFQRSHKKSLFAAQNIFSTILLRENNAINKKNWKIQ